TFTGPASGVTIVSFPPPSAVIFPDRRSPFLSLTSSSAEAVPIITSNSIEAKWRMEVLLMGWAKLSAHMRMSSLSAVSAVADFVEEGFALGRVESRGDRTLQFPVKERQLLELLGRDLLELGVEHLEVGLQRVVRGAEAL